MGKHFFVDGSIVATTGDLYARDLSVGGTWHPDDAIVIVPPGGVLYITEDSGSIFDSYYVSGDVVAGGIHGLSKGDICAFADIYEFTLRDYNKDLKLLRSMLDSIPSGSQGRLYLQQQFASVFSLMERFLSTSFVRQTCDREDSYHRVLESGLLQKRFTAEKKILNGPDCLEKELLYIDVANRIVFHRHGIVAQLFEIAFNISVDFSSLEKQLSIRNDIVHRFGYCGVETSVNISETDVQDLITIVDGIVQSTADQFQSMPPSEKMYPSF